MVLKDQSIPGWCILAVGCGFLARVLLVGLSWGTVDANAWMEYGQQLSELGLAGLTQTVGLFNHPPLPACWASASVKLAGWTGLPFPAIFKIPLVMADAGSCLLVWTITRRRWGAHAGAIVAAAYACSPAAILVAGFACNTDPIYAFFSLLAGYALLRGQPFAAGLALGAAINIKLIPTTLLLPMLILCRSRGELLRMIAGLAIMAIPFLWPLTVAPRHFVRNALQYGSVVDSWGAYALLLPLARSPEWSAAFGPVIEKYWIYGRLLMFAIIGWISLVARRRPIDALHALSACAATFLIVAPGFGVHYMIFVLPLMFATRPGTALIFGLLAGVIQGMTYGYGIDGTLPLRTEAPLHLRPIPALIGIAAWLVLIAFVVQVMWPKPRMCSQSPVRI